jgi:hypothetical protein
MAENAWTAAVSLDRRCWLVAYAAEISASITSVAYCLACGG